MMWHLTALWIFKFFFKDLLFIGIIVFAL